jgi:hypothetical protein
MRNLRLDDQDPLGLMRSLVAKQEVLDLIDETTPIEVLLTAGGLSPESAAI